MTFIKKLVMHGFKSFVRKTELPFTPGINVILGPNGSGKSNISDALCFVLGRLSIKSMRAAKARNLIFLGTKAVGPAKEASVEIVFDNSDKTFSLNESEVVIKRIVRRNGQSVYKINRETKTRQEVLGLLAQAGIDPNGFNIILQGEIQNFVRMHTDERRKIIEEVSGISIYESRKAKSLRELEKTEEKLKEVIAVLRERTAYLNNLEKERQQALRYKKLQKDVQRYKASIINVDLSKKQKELDNVNNDIEKKNKEIAKVKKTIVSLEATIRDYELKVDSINSTIQKSTGLEQEKLNQEIANLRAELAGLNVKSENSERKLSEIQKQKQELQSQVRENELEIKELQKNAVPSTSKKQKDIEAKKKELEKLEEQRKSFYMIKSELKSLIQRIQDKKSILQNYKTESNLLIKEIDNLALDLFDKKLRKIFHTNEYEIDKQNKLIKNISKMDICPLCKNKITDEHIKEIQNEVLPRINSLKKQINSAKDKLDDLLKQRKNLVNSLDILSSELSKRESDLLKLSNINGKKEQIKSLQEKIQLTSQGLLELEKRKKNLETNFDENSNIEQKYETARIEVQEISLRTKENISSEIAFKQREFERSKITLKQLSRDEGDLKEDIGIIQDQIKQKQEILDKKRKQDEELNKKFKKLVSQRDELQSKIRQGDSDLSLKQNLIYNLEQDMNDFKIEKARIGAEIENLQNEISEFKGIQIIKATKESLIHKLNRTQEILIKIGSVNLRSLEVYDDIKKEYDVVKEKVDVLANEKQGILKIIHEIDIKKKKAFLGTLNELNEIFSRNFSQLSTKGQVSLELENKKDPFEGGVNILVKTGHGKYFDVTSLSGGEQTLVALSLIFAIQELRPYCFYILDEIDAALDKRNSERLANLLKKYMQKGQYIVITHNDEVISNATNLYGVSMHDGISKIVSLKI